jgi:phosphohistidine phosphatase
VGTRRLTLLRHAQAEPMDACAEDFERALTHRGTIEAKEIAARIAARGMAPDLILASPAERAWSTAQIVAGACDIDVSQVICARELYLATPETIWRLLAAQRAEVGHILICAHNPGLSHLASRFGPTPQRRSLPTAGLATALWRSAHWHPLQPEEADICHVEDRRTRRIRGSRGRSQAGS